MKNKLLHKYFEYGVEAMIIKRGNKGVSEVDPKTQVIDVPGYCVDVCNEIGAGDAFASGFIYGYLKGWSFYKSSRMGNTCGANVASRHACTNSSPNEKEIFEFINAKGGLCLS